MKIISLVSVAILGACGGGSSPAIDSPSPHDAAAHDSKVFLDSPGAAALTVKNYDAWCSVTVNGGAASTGAQQVVTPAAGTISLAAVALDGFELGPAPWHDTAGDTGTGDPGTVTGTGQSASDATTVVFGTSAKCVWVCCPFTNGTGCPTTDQCP